MKTGKIIQVMGPVVDVEFEDENLPAIRDALEVLNGDKKSVMEVAQHIGNNTVRCIMLASSEGLHRDMEVTATGAGIKTPVGEQTLGRLFNVLGEAIDGGAQPDTEEKWEIHREPPTFEEQNPAEEILETGIWVMILSAVFPWDLLMVSSAAWTLSQQENLFLCRWGRIHLEECSMCSESLSMRLSLHRQRRNGQSTDLRLALRSRLHRRRCLRLE